jgi:signal transduction histidine kinase
VRITAPGTPAGSQARLSLRLALAVLAVLAITVAGAEAALDVAAGVEPLWLVIAFAAVGAQYLLAGALAWSRRPTNRTGFLLCLGGLSVLAASAETTGVDGLVTVGQLAAELPLGVVLHLLLAFPSGRLPDRMSRWLAGIGYAATVGLQVPQVLVGIGTPAAATIDDLQALFGSSAIAVAAVVIARRWRLASGRARRTLELVSGYGVLALAVIIVTPRIEAFLGLAPDTRFALQVLAVAGIPVAFATGVLRGGFARIGEVEELSAWLAASDYRRSALRDGLRTTLGDPSLQLRYWLSETRVYADEHGELVRPPAPGSGRGFVEVELGGRRVGAIEHDARLLGAAEILPGVAAMIALALDRERLIAALRAEREALKRSRSRLVEAGDRERRRIARDLHDVLQARLVLLALTAGRLGAAADDLRAGLDDAIDDLRRLVHGVMPAVLIERGLYAAAEEFVDRVPVPARLDLPAEPQRLPPEVESIGYFFVAEAVTNAIKHSRARRLDVRLERRNGDLVIEVTDDGAGGARFEGGSGLRGLADRVEALGGRIAVESAAGHGTRVTAAIPCAVAGERDRPALPLSPT